MAAESFERAHLAPALANRCRAGTLRALRPDLLESSAPDFSSNDYLGLAHSRSQHDLIKQNYKAGLVGATGSRLLSGDSSYAHQLEHKIVSCHRGFRAALLCNSGYDANLALLSSVGRHCRTILLDELSHNSLYMGARLARVAGGSGERLNLSLDTFRHNCVKDLETKLKKHSSGSKYGQNVGMCDILVVVESVYSMDGDIAPLQEILDVAQRYRACVVVDEAHGLGWLGEAGMGACVHHPALLAAVYTYGKAAGCHGAAVLCRSDTLKQYLLNYGRPIVYSTCLPLHSLVCISCAYDTLMQGEELRKTTRNLILHFRGEMDAILSSLRDNDNDNNRFRSLRLLSSSTPIQAIVVPGNSECQEVCRHVFHSDGIVLYPIRTPTVPQGEERIRIIIHAHNSRTQVSQLTEALRAALDKTMRPQKDGRHSPPVFRSRL